MSKTTKKPEVKEIDPLDIAVNDSFESDFWDGKHFKLEKLTDICHKRGLIGYWTQETLSKPLYAFEPESRGKNEAEVDNLLTAFANTINFDANLVKRHFYAIRQGWEQAFLRKESGLDLFPKDNETMPSAVEPLGKEEQ